MSTNASARLTRTDALMPGEPGMAEAGPRAPAPGCRKKIRTGIVPAFESFGDFFKIYYQPSDSTLSTANSSTSPC